MDMSDEEEVFAKYNAERKKLKKLLKRKITFNDQIAQMGGDNGKFSRKINKESLYETYFEDALETARADDLSEGLDEFIKRINASQIKTYAQVLHGAEKIFEAIVDELSKKESRSIQSMCNLLAALARDLREQFSQYCWKSFEVLFNLLDFGERDIHVIEPAYVCLTVLVKIQAGFLTKNFKKTFTQFIPLTTSSRDFARRFAAESLAYLMRKSSDLKSICMFIMKQASNTPHQYLSDGCSLIFYNTFIGIAGSFHSNCEKMLRDITNAVMQFVIENKNEAEKAEFAQQVLAQMIGYTMEYSEKSKYENRNFYQKVLLEMMKDSKEMKEQIVLMRCLLLCVVENNDNLMNLVVKKKKKREQANKMNKKKVESKVYVYKMFIYPDELKNAINSVVDLADFELNEHVVRFIAEILLNIFDNEKYRVFTRELVLKIVDKTTNNAQNEYLVELLEKLIQLESFDLYLAPSLGKIAKKVEEVEAMRQPVIALYAYLCNQRRPVGETMDRNGERRVFIDLEHHVTFRRFLVNQLKEFETILKSNQRELIDLVLIWPWLFSNSSNVDGIEDVKRILKKVIEMKEPNVLNSQLALVCAAGLFSTRRDELKVIDRDELNEFVIAQNCTESSILLLELYLKMIEQKPNDFNDIMKILKPALKNANANVRRVALKILASFNGTMPMIQQEERKVQRAETIFQILYNAESCELLNYRERLHQFRKIRYGLHKEFIPQEWDVVEVEMCQLYALLSQYFVGFTPLWKGMDESLKTLATGMDIDRFWMVIEDWLQNVTQHIDGKIVHEPGHLRKVDEAVEHDYVKARIELFRLFKKFADVAERRTRILSPLILEIYAKYRSMTESEQLKLEEENNEEEEGEEDEDEDEPVEDFKGKRIEMYQTRQALCELTSVFALFSNLRSAFMADKLYEIFETLLSVSNEDVQKVALDAILAYKNPVVVRYREELEKVLDDKKMRSAIMHMMTKEISEDAPIAEEHRVNVIPVVMRILYGKLGYRMKKKEIGSRRNGIITAIGECRSSEIRIFLNLYFHKVYQIFGERLELARIDQVCESDVSSINREMVRIFIKVLDGLSEILRKISISMESDEQKLMIDVILTSAIVCKHLNRKASGMTNLEKDLRLSTCERLAEFMKAYPTREFGKQEVEVMKTALLEESVQRRIKGNFVEINGELFPIAPHAVIKLLSTISAYPSLYQLLTVKVEWNTEEDETRRQCACLDIMLAPLLWHGITELTLTNIRTALLKLSELTDEPMVDFASHVECERFERSANLNMGTTMLRSRVKLLLDFLSKRIEHEVERMKVPAAESITLLERFSEYVSDCVETANKLAKPLLQCIDKRSVGNEKPLVDMMTSMARIAPFVGEPMNSLERIPKLFLKFETKTLREALISMMHGFAKSPHLPADCKDLMHLICELDAWDRTKVDEPHFERRYAAYSKLMKIWTGNDSQNPVLLSMLVNTHFFTISKTNDLSLRMTAACNVRALVEFAGKQCLETKKKVFEATVIPAVVRFMKHEDDAVRQEAINTLQELVRAYPENNALNQLGKLSNMGEGYNLLADMVDIQIYRRQRVMNRFASLPVQKGDDYTPETFVRYVMPMIEPYLDNTTPKYLALSDACLNVLRENLRHNCTWAEYCKILEKWLSKLERAAMAREGDSDKTEKAIVRVLVAVIEGFQFVSDAIKTEEDAENNPQEGAIVKKVDRVLLPRLTKVLDYQRKAVEKSARTMEIIADSMHMDVRRAPVALALVKLLQKMPEYIMSAHLHGIVLKMCSLMMIKSYEVRESARKTLVKIVKCLGAKYVASIITEITLTMRKGFQMHVAVYTVHLLIVSMRDELKMGDLDSAIAVIMRLVVQDQFKQVAEEKQIGEIKAECPEAKGNKTPETMHHIGKVVSPAAIKLVLEPLREVLNEQPTLKTIQRISDLLSKFVSGIKDNQGLDSFDLLAYIYKNLTEDLKKMQVVEGATTNASAPFKRESCLIIPEAPKRIGATAKSVVRTREHVFAEFFVMLFSALLKEKKFDATDDEVAARLNPFGPLILDCFDFKYEKLITVSLRALGAMLQMKLPVMAENSQRIADTLFVLLRDYSSIGYAGNKPALLQLNQLLYKTFTTYIWSTGCDFLTNEKLTLLLAYAEADILDQNKQATMFSLIKSLVKRGVRHERLEEIMEQLQETAIESPIASIRSQCRETLVDYIGSASDMTKNPTKHIEFFLDQLEYEYESGQQSAAEMLNMLFKNLLPKSLENVHTLCAVKLGAAIVNGDGEKIGAQCALTLRTLLSVINEQQKAELFEISCEWMESEEENAKMVGIQTLVQLSYVDKEAMITQFEKLFTIVSELLFDEELFEKNTETAITAYLNGLTRIITNIGVKCLSIIEALDFIQKLEPVVKCDESLKIRNEAANLIGQILSLLEAKGDARVDEEVARTLCVWMCWIIRHSELDTPTAEQAAKIIVFMIKFIGMEDYSKVIGGIAAACRFEIKHNVKEFTKRLNCFKLTTALFVTADEERKKVVLSMFVPLLVRELKLNANEEMNKLSEEISALIRKTIGEEAYGALVAECQKSASNKSFERKRKLKELAVTAPQDAAELRRRKNKKKTEKRKRKIDEMKPYRRAKRRLMEQKKAREDDED